jgi:hypothetical protein
VAENVIVQCVQVKDKGMLSLSTHEGIKKKKHIQPYLTSQLDDKGTGKVEVHPITCYEGTEVDRGIALLFL